MRVFVVALLMCVVCLGSAPSGHGKHIVFIAADQEYRSEESIPALAKILSARHAFKCTVLYSTNRRTGAIDPTVTDNVPGLEELRSADLLVIFARFLELPDEQMREIIDYTNSGKPIIALRTSTHAFQYRQRLDSRYAKYTWNSKDPDGGYGRLVLGETWIAHYGAHEKESTRGVIVAGMQGHPILTGVHDIWGQSDVYEITNLTGDSKPLVMGQVLKGMEESSPPDPEKKLMPIAWIKSPRVFVTTMGHPLDFMNEGFRRMLVNACYWAVGLEKEISPRANIDFVGTYDPGPIGFSPQ
jgi:hypothetical protein